MVCGVGGDRAGEARCLSALIERLEALERTQVVPGPVVEGAEEHEVEPAGRQLPLGGVEGAGALGELSGEPLVTPEGGDLREGSEHHRVVLQLRASVLQDDLPRPVRVPARERQAARSRLDEREVPEEVRGGGLVPLGHRVQRRAEHVPRLVEPPRPVAAMALGCRGLADRADVPGSPSEVECASRERERLRLTLVVADDGERRERTGGERVVTELIAEPDGLACVRLRHRETLGDARVVREQLVDLQLEPGITVRLPQGLAKALDRGR
ncbi:MAG: hypothetical protein MOP51_159, partial [Citricoccus sp.]|nr:hypothetical protein [Citricoccus sp. WCRC_4]